MTAPAPIHFSDDRDLGALIRACAAGDRSALARIYQVHGSSLLGIAARMVGQRGRAEDIVQETFVSLWKHAASYAPERGAAKAWLVAILRHKAIDRIRQLTREFPTEAATEGALHQASGDPSPFEALSSSQEGARIHYCLEKLDPEPKLCIQYAYFHGMSYEEVSQVLGKPLGTVKSWIRRSMMRLKICLAEGGIDE